MAEHIVAVFETERAAEAAIQSLRQAGISSSAIRQYADTGAVGTAAPTEQTTTHYVRRRLLVLVVWRGFHHGHNAFRLYRRPV